MNGADLLRGVYSMVNIGIIINERQVKSVHVYCALTMHCGYMTTVPRRQACNLY